MQGAATVVHVEVSDTIPVPKERLFALMSDYNNWPKLSSEHPWAKLLNREGDKECLELGETRYGKVTEVHQVNPPDRIEMEETTPGWIGMLVNLFEALPDGTTRLTLKVDISGRGYMKLVAPFKGYVRSRVKKDIFEELKLNAKSIPP